MRREVETIEEIHDETTTKEGVEFAGLSHQSKYFPKCQVHSKRSQFEWKTTTEDTHTSMFNHLGKNSRQRQSMTDLCNHLNQRREEVSNEFVS